MTFRVLAVRESEGVVCVLTHLMAYITNFKLLSISTRVGGTRPVLKRVFEKPNQLYATHHMMINIS